MRPNFSLNFTSIGLALFHRTSDGWVPVGQVNLGEDTFEAHLAELIQRAQLHDDAGIRSKLVIPNDQIRYLSLQTGEISEIERREIVMRTLIGATPYLVEELAFSWTVSGDTTQVAAVARETLEEAEGFAAQYGFNPVSFVAAPEPGQYNGEPYFGPTYFATQDLADEIIERDVVPLPILNDAPPPAPAPRTITDPQSPLLRRQLILPEIDMPARADITPLPTRAANGPVSPQAKTDTPTKPPVPSLAAQAVSPAEKAPLPSGDLARRSGAETLTTAPVNTQRGAMVPLRHPEAEAEQMTIFGARGGVESKPPKRRNRRQLLSVAIILAGLGVAVLSSSQARTLLAHLFSPADSVVTVTEGSQPPADSLPTTSDAALSPPIVAPDLASPDLPAETAVQEEAVRSTPPAPVLTRRPDPATPEEAAARYAATGIWQRAPAQSVAPIPSELGEIRFSEVSPAQRVKDVTGLAMTSALPVVGTGLQALPNPPSPDQTFTLDDRGFVAGTAEGALTPQGHRVYLGAPSVVPPPRPDTAPQTPDGESAGISEGDQTTASDALEGSAAPTPETPTPPVIPEPAPKQDTAALPPPGQLHPKARPADLVPEVTAEADPEELSDLEETGSDLATDEALRPRARPNDFAASIAAAEVASRPLTVPQIQAPTVQPPGPTRASVAQQATEKNALKLRDMNLIGVMGKPSNRSALVRMSNGQIVKVKVGDTLDGGRVAAIGDDELRYVKSNRNLTLRMPKDG